MKNKIKLSNFIKLLPKDKINFIAINALVSLLGFLRSFIYIKFLNLNELGSISLIQTIIMFVSMFHFGFLNGGFRLFVLNDEKQNDKINNIMHTIFCILLIICIVFLVFISNIQFGTILNIRYWSMSLFIGLILLIKHWYNTVLISYQKFSEINKINLISVFLSIFILPTIYFWKIEGALICIVSQPIAYILISLFRNRFLLPNKFYFSIKFSRRVLSYGFIPFLNGIFGLLNLHIEKWAIAHILSKEMLGKFFLASLFTSLFLLIPASLNSIFLPGIVKQYSEKDYISTKNIQKKYLYILIVYAVCVMLATLFMLKPIIKIVFPEHLSNIVFVYYILPGVIILSFADPINLLFNAAKKYYPMFIVYFISVIFNIVGIQILNAGNNYNLINVALLRNIVNSIVIIFLLCFYLFLKKRILFNVNK